MEHYVTIKNDVSKIFLMTLNGKKALSEKKKPVFKTATCYVIKYFKPK